MQLARTTSNYQQQQQKLPPEPQPLSKSLTKKQTLGVPTTGQSRDGADKRKIGLAETKTLALGLSTISKSIQGSGLEGVRTNPQLPPEPQPLSKSLTKKQTLGVSTTGKSRQGAGKRKVGLAETKTLAFALSTIGEFARGHDPLSKGGNKIPSKQAQSSYKYSSTSESDDDSMHESSTDSDGYDVDDSDRVGCQPEPVVESKSCKLRNM